MKSINIVFVFIFILFIWYFLKFMYSLIVKIHVSNTLIICWDIYCKQNMMLQLNVLNVYKNLYIGKIYKYESNYICLMNRHPQEYSNIHILYNQIIQVITDSNITNIISFSTAGSSKYNVGSVLQFNSAIIENPQLYDLSNNYIRAKNTFVKTTVYLDLPIINTKGFVDPLNQQVASGEDEFVIYKIGNDLNISTLTLTGISDNNNKQEYNGGGGNLAAKNAIDYFFTHFTLK
jgi:hypothetical protein